LCQDNPIVLTDKHTSSLLSLFYPNYHYLNRKPSFMEYQQTLATNKEVGLRIKLIKEASLFLSGNNPLSIEDDEIISEVLGDESIDLVVFKSGSLPDVPSYHGFQAQKIGDFVFLFRDGC